MNISFHPSLSSIISVCPIEVLGVVCNRAGAQPWTWGWATLILLSSRRKTGSEWSSKLLTSEKSEASDIGCITGTGEWLLGGEENLPWHLLQNINIEKKLIMLKLE
jgi:hypothetical protein